MQLKLNEFACKITNCPACGTSLFIKFDSDETAVRCLQCRATPITLSLISVLHELLPDLRNVRAYELSSRGALVNYLRPRVSALTTSELFDDVAIGGWKHGTQCQDVTQLTYADGSFDLCTSTEVFEHVPDALAGFRALFRVLAPGGTLVFTVPMSGQHETITRATMTADGLVHWLPPEYHADRIRGPGKVLCYRVYGDDIVDQLELAGFSEVSIRRPERQTWFGFARNVIVARKA